MRSHTRSPSGLSRGMSLAVVLFTGLLVTGCTSEYIEGLKSGAETLRSSGEFSQVNFEYERGFDPMTRPRRIDDYSAVLHQDSDVIVAGQALADAAEIAGNTPDVLVDESTWVFSFHEYKGTPESAELTAQDWAELLHVARSTHARELEVWQFGSFDAEEQDDYDPKLSLKVSAATPADGLDDLEQLVSTHVPAGIRDVFFELQAGSEQLPWHYETPPAGRQPYGNYDAPIQILVPGDKEIGNARAVLDAAQQHFGELYEFSFYYWEDIPHIEILHDGTVETCQENIVYAEQAAELLDEDLDITLSKSSSADGLQTEIYHEVSEASAKQGKTSNGCNLDM